MTELNTMEHYKIAQSKFKCKIGDRVRVSQSCKSCERGWRNIWVPEMDLFVGKYSTIKGINEVSGILISEINLWFPYFCLDIVE